MDRHCDAAHEDAHQDGGDCHQRLPSIPLKYFAETFEAYGLMVQFETPNTILQGG